MNTLPLLAANDNTENEGFVLAVLDARAALRRAVETKLPRNASFGDREALLLNVANEVCRIDLAAELQAIANRQSQEILVDGVLYKHHQDGSAEYHSLCGTFCVMRATYRKAGVRNGPTVVPLDLVAGIVEGATPALAYRVALGYAQGPGRHAEEQMHADHRQPPSRSTLERMAKAIGTSAKTAASRIETVLRQEEELPEGTRHRRRGASVAVGPTCARPHRQSTSTTAWHTLVPSA
jgi:hypothetical protein